MRIPLQFSCDCSCHFPLEIAYQLFLFCYIKLAVSLNYTKV